MSVILWKKKCICNQKTHSSYFRGSDKEKGSKSTLQNIFAKCISRWKPFCDALKMMGNRDSGGWAVSSPCVAQHPASLPSVSWSHPTSCCQLGPGQVYRASPSVKGIYGTRSHTQAPGINFYLLFEIAALSSSSDCQTA